MIGTPGFSSLDDAIAFAVDGDTIELSAWEPPHEGRRGHDTDVTITGAGGRPHDVHAGWRGGRRGRDVDRGRRQPHARARHGRSTRTTAPSPRSPSEGAGPSMDDSLFEDNVSAANGGRCRDDVDHRTATSWRTAAAAARSTRAAGRPVRDRQHVRGNHADSSRRVLRPRPRSRASTSPRTTQPKTAAAGRPTTPAFVTFVESSRDLGRWASWRTCCPTIGRSAGSGPALSPGRPTPVRWPSPNRRSMSA